MAKEKMVKEYIALFEHDDEAGYGVVFPDLPGCFSAGDDYDDAVRNAHEALALYAEGNDNMPEPRSLEEIKAGWADWKEWEKEYKFLIGKVALYPMKTKAQRFNITMRSDLVARVDRVASNRCAFIETATENLLKQGEYKEPARNKA
jgi:predicted RNase H-like HicB family nuclease